MHLYVFVSALMAFCFSISLIIRRIVKSVMLIERIPTISFHFCLTLLLCVLIKWYWYNRNNVISNLQKTWVGGPGGSHCIGFEKISSVLLWKGISPRVPFFNPRPCLGGFRFLLRSCFWSRRGRGVDTSWEIDFWSWRHDPSASTPPLLCTCFSLCLVTWDTIIDSLFPLMQWWSKVKCIVSFLASKFLH